MKKLRVLISILTISLTTNNIAFLMEDKKADNFLDEEYYNATTEVSNCSTTEVSDTKNKGLIDKIINGTNEKYKQEVVIPAIKNVIYKINEIKFDLEKTKNITKNVIFSKNKYENEKGNELILVERKKSKFPNNKDIAENIINEITEKTKKYINFLLDNIKKYTTIKMNLNENQINEIKNIIQKQIKNINIQQLLSCEDEDDKNLIDGIFLDTYNEIRNIKTTNSKTILENDVDLNNAYNTCCTLLNKIKIKLRNQNEIYNKIKKCIKEIFNEKNIFSKFNKKNLNQVAMEVSLLDHIIYKTNYQYIKYMKEVIEKFTHNIATNPYYKEISNDILAEYYTFFLLENINKYENIETNENKHKKIKEQIQKIIKNKIYKINWSKIYSKLRKKICKISLPENSIIDLIKRQDKIIYLIQRIETKFTPSNKTIHEIKNCLKENFNIIYNNEEDIDLKNIIYNELFSIFHFGFEDNKILEDILENIEFKKYPEIINTVKFTKEYYIDAPYSIKEDSEKKYIRFKNEKEIIKFLDHIKQNIIEEILKQYIELDENKNLKFKYDKVKQKLRINQKEIHLENITSEKLNRIQEEFLKSTQNKKLEREIYAIEKLKNIIEKVEKLTIPNLFDHPIKCVEALLKEAIDCKYFALNDTTEFSYGNENSDPFKVEDIDSIDNNSSKDYDSIDSTCSRDYDNSESINETLKILTNKNDDISKKTKDSKSDEMLEDGTKDLLIDELDSYYSNRILNSIDLLDNKHDSYDLDKKSKTSIEKLLEEEKEVIEAVFYYKQNNLS